jgi:hypothetical protein
MTLGKGFQSTIKSKRLCRAFVQILELSGTEHGCMYITYEAYFKETFIRKNIGNKSTVDCKLKPEQYQSEDP